MCNFCAENIKLRKKKKRSNVDNVLNDMVDKLLNEKKMQTSGSWNLRRKD